jgi:hypothetical protein
MKTKILVAAIVVIFLAACGKDKYNTKPSLVFKSVSGDVVPIRGSLRFEFEVFDKEGDISDTFYIKKVRLNRRTTPTIRDSVKLRFPDVPDTKKGIIELNLTYDNYLTSAINPGNPPENDTLLFKFVIRDKAKNVSDTFTSNPIVVLR